MSKTGILFAALGGCLVGYLLFILNRPVQPEPEQEVIASAKELIAEYQATANVAQTTADNDSGDSGLDSDSEQATAAFNRYVIEGRLDLASDVLLNRLLETDNYAEAAALLSADYVRVGEYRKSLEIIFDAIDQLPFERQQALTELVKAQTVLIETELAKALKHELLIELYQYLAVQQPDVMRHYLRLSYWQIKSGKFDEANTTLIATNNDIASVDEANRLRGLIESAKNGQADQANAIPLVRNRDQYIVKVMLNDTIPARLMLDTGASLTVLKTSFANLYGLDNNFSEQNVQVNTAGGITFAAVTELGSLQLGEGKVSPLNVALLDLDGLEADGLLGMNFLRHFRFSLDQDADSLILEAQNSP